jgi:hypothetical protein
MTLPRTLKTAGKGAAANARGDRGSREVKPTPEIFVRVSTWTYQGSYAQARIRVRKGCYQYLVWRDGDKTREFYLGKKETRTPQVSAGAGARSGARARAAGARARGTK